MEVYYWYTPNSMSKIINPLSVYSLSLVSTSLSREQLYAPYDLSGWNSLTNPLIDWSYHQITLTIPRESQTTGMENLNFMVCVENGAHQFFYEMSDFKNVGTNWVITAVLNPYLTYIYPLCVYSNNDTNIKVHWKRKHQNRYYDNNNTNQISANKNICPWLWTQRVPSKSLFLSKMMQPTSVPTDYSYATNYDNAMAVALVNNPVWIYKVAKIESGTQALKQSSYGYNPFIYSPVLTNYNNGQWSYSDLMNNTTDQDLALIVLPFSLASFSSASYVTESLFTGNSAASSYNGVVFNNHQTNGLNGLGALPLKSTLFTSNGEGWQGFNPVSVTTNINTDVPNPNDWYYLINYEPSVATALEQGIYYNGQQYPFTNAYWDIYQNIGYWLPQIINNGMVVNNWNGMSVVWYSTNTPLQTDTNGWLTLGIGQLAPNQLQAIVPLNVEMPLITSQWNTFWQQNKAVAHTMSKIRDESVDLASYKYGSEIGKTWSLGSLVSDIFGGGNPILQTMSSTTDYLKTVQSLNLDYSNNYGLIQEHRMNMQNTLRTTATNNLGASSNQFIHYLWMPTYQDVANYMEVIYYYGYEYEYIGGLWEWNNRQTFNYLQGEIINATEYYGLMEVKVINDCLREGVWIVNTGQGLPQVNFMGWINSNQSFEGNFENNTEDLPNS